MNEALRNYLNPHYVYHGSSEPDIEVFTPQKSHDAGTDEWNKTESVYATSNMCFAIIFSLTKSYSGRFQVRSNTRSIFTATFDNSFKETLFKNSGYLYVFNEDQFPFQKSNQVKTNSEIKPITMIQVDIDDYFDLGGKIEFVE